MFLPTSLLLKVPLITSGGRHSPFNRGVVGLILRCCVLEEDISSAWPPVWSEGPVHGSLAAWPLPRAALTAIQ